MADLELTKPNTLTKAVVRFYSPQYTQSLLDNLQNLGIETEELSGRNGIDDVKLSIRNSLQQGNVADVYYYTNLLHDLTIVLGLDGFDRGVFVEGKDFIKQEGGNQIFLNGNLKHLTEANALSGSFQYAISTFLGCMAYRQPDGSMKVVRMQDQIKRLRSGIAALGMNLDYTDEQIAEAIQWTASQSAKEHTENNKSDIVYIRPFARANAKNYGISGENMTHYVDLVVEAEYFDYLGKSQRLHIPRDLVREELHPTQKHSAQYHKIRELGDRIKTDSSLQDDGGKPKYTGGVMLDKAGNIAEMANNIFFVKKGENTIVTPRLGEILPGFTRDTVVRLLQLRGYTVEEGDIKPNELGAYEGCFTTGTASACKEVELINYQETDYIFNTENSIVTQIKEDYLHFVCGDFAYFGEKAEAYQQLSDMLDNGDLQ